jgi:hypothetical protein
MRHNAKSKINKTKHHSARTSPHALQMHATVLERVGGLVPVARVVQNV